jgi:hypothetical protein
MTTLTLKNSIVLDRYEFEDIDDLIVSLFHIKDTNAVDFHELSEDQVDDDLRKTIEASKAKPLGSFTSVSSS